MMLESKAEAVRRALEQNELRRAKGLAWPKKEVLTFAVANWKARRGNLSGRPHPSERMPWPVWRSVTAKRYAKRMQRIDRANGNRANAAWYDKEMLNHAT